MTLLFVLCGIIYGSIIYAQIKSNIDTSITTIKKYRISKMSDQHIKDLWELAEKIRLEEIQDIEKRKKEFLESRARSLKSCSDFVYEQRNEWECLNARSLMTIILSDEKPRGRDAIYEALVLGACNFIDNQNINELRKYGCIP